MAPSPGVLGLSYASSYVTSLPTYLGFDLGGRLALADGRKIELTLRSAWMHEFEPNQSSVSPSFNAAPGPTFQVSGAGTAPDALVETVTAKLLLSDHLTLFGKFDGQFSSNSRGYMGTAGVLVDW